MGVDAEQTLQIIHTGYPWRKLRTCLRPCSVRWLVYHEHGFGYSDDQLEPRCATTIRTPLLLHRLRDLIVIYFCTTMYYILVARQPHFCIMTSHFGCLMKNFYDDRFYLFTCVKMYVCDEIIVFETNSNISHSQHMSQQLDYRFLEYVCMLCCQISILTISHVRIFVIISDP